MVPTLKMRRLRLREIKTLAQGHRRRKVAELGFEPRPAGSKVHTPLPDPGFPKGVCLVNFTGILIGPAPKKRILWSEMFKNHGTELVSSLLQNFSEP